MRGGILWALLASFLHPVHVVARKFDVGNRASSWLQEYFGHANRVTFLEESSRTLVRTDNEFLLLNLEDGAIIWRRESAYEELCVSESADRIVGSSVTSLEGWAISSGQLAWRVAAGAITCLCSEGQLVFTCQLGGYVTAYSAEDGEELWSRKLPDIRPHFMICSVRSKQLTVHAVTHQQAATLLHAFMLHINSGQVLRQAEIEAPTTLSDVMVHTSNMLVALSSDFSQACSFAILPSEGVDCADLPKSVRHAAQQATPTLVQGDSDVVSLTVEPYDQKRAFLLIQASNLQMTALQQAVSAASAPFRSGTSSVVLALDQTPGSSFRACLVDCITGLHTSVCQNISQHSAGSTGHLSNASAVWMQRSAMTGGSASRCVFITEHYCRFDQILELHP